MCVNSLCIWSNCELPIQLSTSHPVLYLDAQWKPWSGGKIFAPCYEWLLRYALTTVGYKTYVIYLIHKSHHNFHIRRFLPRLKLSIGKMMLTHTGSVMPDDKWMRKEVPFCLNFTKALTSNVKDHVIAHRFSDKNKRQLTGSSLFQVKASPLSPVLHQTNTEPNAEQLWTESRNLNENVSIIVQRKVFAKVHVWNMSSFCSELNRSWLEGKAKRLVRTYHNKGPWRLIASWGRMC